MTTANIGKFHGGSATNIVADEVVLEAEARSHSDTMTQNNKYIKKRLNLQLKHLWRCWKCSKSYPGFKIPDARTCRQIAVNSAHALGLSGDTVICGGSEGSIMAMLGIPTAILGVGYEAIHTTSEKNFSDCFMSIN